MSEKLTAEQAKSFSGKSEASIAILDLAAEARGCSCVPYQDWFTYRRWKAQGQQVQKGEHGVKLTVFIPVVTTDEDGQKKATGKRPKATTVFCRCQVRPKGGI